MSDAVERDTAGPWGFCGVVFGGGCLLLIVVAVVLGIMVPSGFPSSPPLRHVFTRAECVCVGTVIASEKGWVRVRVEEVIKGDPGARTLELDFETYVDSSYQERRTHFDEGALLLLMLRDSWRGWREVHPPGGLTDVGHERRRSRITAARELAFVEGLPAEERLAAEVEWVVSWIERGGGDALGDLCSPYDDRTAPPARARADLVAALEDRQVDRLLATAVSGELGPFWAARVLHTLQHLPDPRIDQAVRDLLGTLSVYETARAASPGSGKYGPSPSVATPLLEVALARFAGPADARERLAALHARYVGLEHRWRDDLEQHFATCRGVLREFVSELDAAEPAR